MPSKFEFYHCHNVHHFYPDPSVPVNPPNHPRCPFYSRVLNPELGCVALVTCDVDTISSGDVPLRRWHHRALVRLLYHTVVDTVTGHGALILKRGHPCALSGNEVMTSHYIILSYAN